MTRVCQVKESKIHAVQLVPVAPKTLLMEGVSTHTSCVLQSVYLKQSTSCCDKSHGGTIMASLRSQVLGGYKRLLRARMVAFKDDVLMLEKSREQLRLETDKNRAVTDPKQIGERKEHGHVNTILDERHI